MAGHASGSIDVLRKCLIIGCLIAGMVLLHRFDAPGDAFDPTGMLALGFVILASYTVGELVGVIKLPHITGYLFAGVLLGPSFAHLLPVPETWAPFDHGVLNTNVMNQLGLFNTLALALIAITAGGELKIDGLRQGFKKILGVLTGQSIATFLFIPAFFVAISGFIPGIGLDAFAGFGLTGSLAIGAMLAAISLATSPAATIAVINEAQAKGEVTDTTLATVVLKDVVVVVLFSLTAAISVSLLGAEGTTPGELAKELSWHILGSLAVGAALGLAMAMYLSWVRHEVLLFLVGVVFTAAFVSEQLHFDLALLFIAAGFTASNFSEKGDTLIHEVERLSTPVYVVFFTLAGAQLHLDTLAQMAPYALALVAVRMGAFYIGVRTGSSVADASENLKKYGWLGYISQAGVALTLADLARKVPDAALYPGAGDTLATLVIAGIAVHEVIGPIALKISLGLARELPMAESEPSDPEEQDGLTVEDTIEVEDTDFTEVVSVDEPLDRPLESQSQKLNAISQEWSEDLQTEVRDFVQGPLSQMIDDHQQHLKEVRREFLRYHRRLTVLLKEPNADTAEALRAEQQRSAERWRQFTLRRAFAIRKHRWSPLELVTSLDLLVDGLPETLQAPLEPHTYHGDSGESPVLKLLRTGLKFRRWLSFIAGNPKRQIRYRTLARYHFSGLAPSELEPVAALMVQGEHHLIVSTRNLFEQMMSATESLIAAQLSQSGTQEAALRAFRQDLEEEFNLATDEIQRSLRDIAHRLGRLLGGIQVRFHQDLLRIGTIDLLHWSRRYSRAFTQRTRGMRLLETGYPEAREQIGFGLQTLALELELLGFEGFARSALDLHAAPLARRIQGKGYTQVQRVYEQLTKSVTTLDGLLENEENCNALAEGIRAATDPLHRVAIEAVENTESLLLELQGDHTLGPLLDALTNGAASLSETYEIPAASPSLGDWKLANKIPSTEIPFRRAMASNVESSVSGALLECVRSASSHVESLHDLLSEFERMVPFNRELATGDLAGLEMEKVPAETRALIREMLVGALSRSQQRLDEALSLHRISAEELLVQLETATIQGIEQLRNELTSGDLKAVSTRLKQEAATQRVFGREGRGVRSLLQSGWDRVAQTAATLIGPHRLERWRDQLGLGDPIPEHPLMARDFHIDSPADRIPVVYRRLFSDRALEAGDLLSGREAEFDRALSILHSNQNVGCRSVALVGPQGVGKRALVAALGRKFSKIHRLEADGPCTTDDVGAWLRAEGKDCLFLAPKLHWLLSMQEQGTQPLQMLIDRIVADRGRNAFLLVADTPNWEFATQATSIQHAMAHVASINPLNIEDLSGALLMRHAMSGYALAFPQPSRLPKFLGRIMRLAGEANLQQEAGWFEALHKTSGGIMQDAMAQWLNAIQQFDESEATISMGVHGPNALSALDRLPDDLLLTLRIIGRQGWMNAKIHSELFRLPVSHSNTVLSRLLHFGLVVEHNGLYELSDRFAGGIYQTLQRRGWSS